jgi:hypothetical protein
MPISVPRMVASTMPITATRRVLAIADDEGPEVGVARTIGEQAVGNRHARFAAEKGKAGGDAAGRQVGDGVGPEEGDHPDRDSDHQDLPEQAFQFPSSERAEKRRRGGGLGPSDVTAQKSFSKQRFPAAHVNCCTKR